MSNKIKHTRSAASFLVRPLLFVTLLTLAASCTKETPFDNPNGGNTPPPVTSGPVDVKLRLSIPEMNVVNTRSSTIGHIYVMTFNANGDMTDAPTPALLLNQGQPDEEYYIATLKASEGASRTVVILINSKAGVDAYKANTATGYPAGEWKVMGNPEVTSTNATKLSHMEANLKTIDLEPSTHTALSPKALISQPTDPRMAGKVTLAGGISSTTVITDSGDMLGNPVEMTRATSKFTVSIPATGGVSSDPNLKIVSASLFNAPKNGYIFPQGSPLPLNNTEQLNYAKGGNTAAIGYGAGFMPLADAVADTCNLYSYEQDAASTHKMFVILKAKYKGDDCFYRIDLVGGTSTDDPQTRAQLDIERNTWYRIRITRATNRGYATAAEAAANRASNLSYTITAAVQSDTFKDPHDIISNGDYMLGVSNSEFIAYENSAILTTIAFTLTHNADHTKVTTGKITVEGNINLALNPSDGITLSNGWLGTLDLSRKVFDVKINTTLSYSSGATIIIQIGNLKKSIKVEKRTITPGGVITDFTSSDYVMAEMADDYTSWLNFGRTATDYDPTATRVDKLTAGTYIYLSMNPSTTATREASDIYISRKSADNGRIKLLINQPFSTYGTPPSTRSYVGAFWRAGQSGERLINNYAVTAGGRWWARVVWMDSGWTAGDIVLDAPTSPPTYDAALSSTNGEGAAWISYATAQMVSGTVSAGGNIHFRIGLKSTLPTATSKPRYAVVQLTYEDGKKQQLICLRQGEADDIVGQGTDVKWSPYNLEPTSYASANQTSFKFTDYPTQAGGFKQFDSKTTMWSPVTALTPNTWSTTVSNPMNNVCSYVGSYKIPTSNGAYNPASNYNNGQTNEMGSLFVGTNTASTLSYIFGYYADGYFDRRAIGKPGGTSQTDNSGVAIDTDNVGYNGFLFVNNTTYSHLFLPATGFRSSGGALSYAGNRGYYWSSTPNSGGYYLYFRSGYVSQTTETNTYQGFNFRCIKTPSPDGVNPPDGGDYTPWR